MTIFYSKSFGGEGLTAWSSTWLQNVETEFHCFKRWTSTWTQHPRGI